MGKAVFEFASPEGEPWRETLSFTANDDGGLEVVVTNPISTTTMALPLTKLGDLIQGLCSIPPHSSLVGTKPVVLYFDTDQDRAEFVALVREAKPGLRAVPL